MSTHELFLLSPYRLPTHSTLYLGDEDVAGFLNGYVALWHPAALHGASGPPRIASPYDHEQPLPGAIYAVPTSPPPLLPDDWQERVRAAGAVAFQASPDRQATVQALLEALRQRGDGAPPASLLELDREKAGPFLGIGFGHVQIEALFEAMSHENLMDTAELWRETQDALAALDSPDQDLPRRHLESAANVLVSAREVLYPSPVYLLDLVALEEGTLDAPWPIAFDLGSPLNVVGCSALLEKMAERQPDKLAGLRERVTAGFVEVCGGLYVEREDSLLPVESQLWSLQRGQQVLERLLGRKAEVFARQRFGWHPGIPSLLQSAGMSRALLISFDETVLPHYHATVVSWPASDGKQVDAFARKPQPADTPQTWFHLAYHLHQTIMQDMSATLVLLHRGRPAGPGYEDLLELSRLAPVLGRFSTFSDYFNEVMAGDYASPSEADEFHDDYLIERTPGEETARWACSTPVTGFTEVVRNRRRLDAAWTLTALQRSLGGRQGEKDAAEERLPRLEDQLESGQAVTGELQAVLDGAAQALAQRLVARGAEQPGYLLLNPCSYVRRVIVEIPDCPHLLPLEGPVKACQVDGTTARAVVEVPALGFAWMPRRGNPSLTPPPKRMQLADERGVRNEFFEAEIDPATGGLRGLRDHRTRVNRLGQQLVFQPGSTMRATEVRVTSAGPALGEVVAEGVLVDSHDNELARFRQRYQAWIGRPLLELRVEIEPVKPPEGFPWHAYYGARFAWRDEYAALLRGVSGVGYVTSHNRPVTPDYLELRVGQQNTVLFPGGLPFHQRHGGRMLDILLITPGETCRSFDLGISTDRPIPMQTAQGLISPVIAVPVAKGPPHVGTTGWLCHVDAPNLLLTSLRPAEGDGVLARFQETTGFGGTGEIRFVRNPVAGQLRDLRGEAVMDLSVQGDAVVLEFTRHDLFQSLISFS